MFESGRPHPLEKTKSICCHKSNLKELPQIVAPMDSPCLKTCGTASTHISIYTN